MIIEFLYQNGMFVLACIIALALMIVFGYIIAEAAYWVGWLHWKAYDIIKRKVTDGNIPADA